MFLLRLVFLPVRLIARLIIPLVLLAALGLVIYVAFWLPDVSVLVEDNPETTAFIERSRSIQREEKKPIQIRQEWAPIDKISPHLVEAVLIAEDDRFYQHRGFDFTEIVDAVGDNLEAWRWVRGGSTITQQLAKNLYLAPDKTVSRKFNEALLTWKLEQSLTKERILELYLNCVEWGYGCFGAEAASRYYFSKSAADLSPREAASLAARLPNPEYLGSRSGIAKRRKRETMILRRMADRDFRPRKPMNQPKVAKRLPTTDRPSTKDAVENSEGGPSGRSWEVVAEVRNRLQKEAVTWLKERAPDLVRTQVDDLPAIEIEEPQVKEAGGGLLQEKAEVRRELAPPGEDAQNPSRSNEKAPSQRRAHQLHERLARLEKALSE